jgi:hypothetical protein
MRKTILLCIGALVLQTTCAQHTILIKQVNIIDVEKGKLIKNATVLISDSVITSITTGKSTFTADTVIEGRNRYLMPGLWDMHGHIWNDSLFFPLLLANGVTGVRDMFNFIQSIHRWRRDIASGKTIGPQIIAAGPVVDGPKPMWSGSVAVKDPEHGRKAVDSLKNILHTDFIKVYSLLPRESYFAIAEEANKQHIPFAGHVPYYVSVAEAARSGQKSQEHLDGFLEAASDSSDYYMQLLQKKITDTTIKGLPQSRKFLHRTYSAQKLQQVLQEIKKYDTWICPTLTVNYNITAADDTARLSDARMQYMPRAIAHFWNPANDFRFKSWTPETYKIFKQDFKMRLEMVKPIFDAGIPLLAGTDFPNPFCFPGFSLHNELQWLVKAGLTPAQALQTATVNAARYLNLQNQYGSVATGKIADLVLLDANPLINIENTQSIQVVIVHGKVLNKAAINNMLARVKKMAGN